MLHSPLLRTHRWAQATTGGHLTKPCRSGSTNSFNKDLDRSNSSPSIEDFLKRKNNPQTKLKTNKTQTNKTNKPLSRHSLPCEILERMNCVSHKLLYLSWAVRVWRSEANSINQSHIRMQHPRQSPTNLSDLVRCVTVCVSAWHVTWQSNWYDRLIADTRDATRREANWRDMSSLSTLHDIRDFNNACDTDLESQSQSY